MINENERQQSEFNMAVSYLGRLNNLFYVADNSAIELNAHTWFHTLLAIFRELSTEMKDNEIKEWEKEISKINIMIANYLKETTRSIDVGIPPSLYDKLHKLEIYLRKVLKDSGLQMKMQEDASFALR